MGRKGPKRRTWIFEPKLRTRRPGVRIPHGVPSSSRTSYCSRRRFFSESSSLTHFVAPPPKTGPAFAGLRFCFISGGSRSFKRLLQVLRLPSPVAAVFAFLHPKGDEVSVPEGQIANGVAKPHRFPCDVGGVFVFFLACTFRGLLEFNNNSTCSESLTIQACFRNASLRMSADYCSAS